MNEIKPLGATVRSDVGVTITKIETIPLHTPFKTPFKIANGAPRPIVETLLVRLHTDAGFVGIGETQAWRRQGSAETLPNLVRNIHDHFTPHVVGRSPFEIAAIMNDLDEALYNSTYAQAPISDALYDLQGKILGVPVYQLLGGKCRSSIAVCAVLSIKPTLAETMENAQAFFDRGFRCYTLKIGNDAKADVALATAIRERFGDSVRIRADANAGMNYDDALMLLKKLEPFDLDAVEQPIGKWDVDGLAELARKVNMPIMADECVLNEHDLLEVIKKRAATVFQTKVAKNGGIWGMRKLWTISHAAGMRIYPGNHPSTSVATASAAHLAAAWPYPLLEGPFAVGVSGALADDYAVDPIRPDGNLIHVPEGPGLGIELDEDKLKKYRVDA